MSFIINNKRHREDGPAIEYTNGDKEWWLNNVNNERQPDYFGKKPVRESLDEEPYVDYEEHDPVIDEYGSKYWYINGKLHREDGLAIEYVSGSKYWYINGKLHREDGPAIEYVSGAKHWYLNGEPHREDGPARIWANGDKVWYINGERHREDGPAIERTSGSKEWWLNGKRQPDYFGKKLVRERLDEEPYVDYEEPDTDEDGTIRWYNEDGELHREDGPAIEYADGDKEWYINGKLHRENGPAIEFADDYKGWYLNNNPHREDGPAVIYTDGTKEWWLNGERHREDGPAIEYVSGYKEWYLNGERQPDYFGKKPTS